MIDTNPDSFNYTKQEAVSEIRENSILLPDIRILYQDMITNVKFGVIRLVSVDKSSHGIYLLLAIVTTY